MVAKIARVCFVVFFALVLPLTLFIEIVTTKFQWPIWKGAISAIAIVGWWFVGGAVVFFVFFDWGRTLSGRERILKALSWPGLMLHWVWEHD